MNYSPAYSQLIEHYPHLEYSRAVPSPQEHQSLFNAKKLHEEKHTLLQKEIDVLQTRLNEAQNELEEVQQQMNAHSNLLSPLRRVPPELLRDIFAASVPKTALGLQDMTLVAPWTLLRVCKGWRDVCLMYGSLWGTINIEIDETTFGPEFPSPPPIWPGLHPAHLDDRHAPEVSRTARACQLLEIQLERSRDADLTIFIGTTWHGNSTNFAQPFLRILIPHLPRCVRLTAPYHILAHTPLPTMARLAHVTIDYRSTVQWGDDPSSQNAALFDSERKQIMLSLSEQPKLRYLAAIMNIYPRNIIRNLLPARHRPHLPLTKLMLSVMDLEVPSWAESVCSQLAECSELAELTFHDAFQAGADPEDAEQFGAPPHKKTCLPRLRKLEVCNYTRSRIGLTLLRSLQLPRLTSLSVIASIAGASSAIVEMLSRSSANLHCLKIHSDHLFGDEIDNLVTAEPHIWSSLQELEIQSTSSTMISFNHHNRSGLLCHPIFNDNILRILTRQFDHENQCTFNVFPSLAYLDLRLINPSLPELVDMLESRCRPGELVPLTGCKLANILSPYTQHTPSQIEAKYRKRVVTNIHAQSEIDQQLGIDDYFREKYLSQHSNGVGQIERNMGMSGCFYNPQLWWDEALKREPTQMERLRKLEEKGLELWMKRSNFLEGTYIFPSHMVDI